MKRILVTWLLAQAVFLLAHGQQITVTQIIQYSKCWEHDMELHFKSSQLLPPGDYRVQLSDEFGSFAAATNIATYNVNRSDSLFFFMVPIPIVNEGTCYRLSVMRVTTPFITSASSACFKLLNCIDTIRFDTRAYNGYQLPDSVCALSSMNTEFRSTGTYLTGNSYSLQLSDSTGAFEIFDTTVSGSDTFVHTINLFSSIGEITLPYITAIWSNIIGRIPAVPEGCNYYIRVSSSHPLVRGIAMGPFCLQHCDIVTNGGNDLHLCVSDNIGVDTAITVDIHRWNSSALYYPGNHFTAQLIYKRDFLQTNPLDLDIISASTDTTMTLSLPSHNDFFTLNPFVGFYPGEYFLRIVADSSSQPWNRNGTMVRLTIGAPRDSVRLEAYYRTFACYEDHTPVVITVNPYELYSDYEWQSDLFFPVPSVVNNQQQRFFDFYGASPGAYDFYVREINYGCYGPVSPALTVSVLDVPDIEISGIDTLYAGDTVSYSATTLDSTAYNWTVSGATIISDSGRSILVRFDSVGNYAISLTTSTSCDIVYDSLAVVVLPDTFHTGIIHSRQEVVDLYPNPASDRLMVSIPTRNEFSYCISDISGKEIICNSSIQPGESINVKRLIPGIYLLKAITAEGAVYYKRFVRR